MHGNWLQNTLNWYWFTWWQLAICVAVILGTGLYGVYRIGKKR